MANRDTKQPRLGLPAADWLEFFSNAKVEPDRLQAAKGRQGQITVAANFLARMVNRPVSLEAGGRTGRAVLRSKPGRSRRKVYYFEVVFEDEGPSGSDGGEDRPQPKCGSQCASRKPPRGAEKGTEVESRANPVDRRPARTYVAAENKEAW